MIGFINQMLRLSNKKTVPKYVDKVESQKIVTKEIKVLDEEHDQDDEIDALLHHYFEVDIDAEEPEDSFIFI